MRTEVVLSERSSRLIAAALVVAVLAVATAAGVVLIGAPALMAGLLAALGLTAIALFRPRTIAVPFALWLLFTNVTVVAVQFHGAPGATPLIVPALIAPAFLAAVVGSRRVQLDTGLALVALYLAVNLLAGMVSDFPDRALAALLSLAAEGALIYFLVLNVVSDRQTLRRAVWGVLAAAAFIGGMAVLQALFSEAAVDFGGLATRGPADESADPILRAAGSIGEPNFFAQMMLLALPFAVALGLAAPSRGLRALAGASGLLITVGVVLSYSRGGAIALAGVVVLLVLFSGMNRRRAIAATAAGLLVMTIVAPDYADHVASLAQVGALAEGNRVEASIEGRVVENIAAARMFADHPLVGVGPGNYPGHYKDYAADYPVFRERRERTPHNLLLEIGAETGIIGLAAFTALHAWLGWRLLGVARRSQDVLLRRLAVASMIALAGYMLTGLSLHAAYPRFFWLVVAIAGAVIAIAKTHELAERHTTEQRTILPR